MIGTGRGTMGKQWWGYVCVYVYIYIYIWLVAVATEEKCPRREEGEPNSKKHVSYLLASFFPKTLKMGQTSDPKTLVIHQKTMPGNNPEDFKQHYDHGGSLQLHIVLCYQS
jgi:hypothetical protein